ncbi:MAG: hypothetical protein ABUK01_10590 [Leptospirales bacterium]
MKIKKIQIFSILMLSLFLVNCHSFSSYKTAKALDRSPGGKPQIQIITAISYNPVFEQYTTSAYDDIYNYEPEFMLRLPILPGKVDFALKISTYSVAADLKIQFMKGPLSMAIDVEGVYWFYNLMDAGLEFYEINPSLLITLDLTPWLSLTVAPKMLYGIYKYSGFYMGGVQTITSLMYGGAVTLDIGKKIGLMPEVTYYYDPLLDENVTTIGVGIRLGGYVTYGKGGKAENTPDTEPGSDLDNLAD